MLYKPTSPNPHMSSVVIDDTTIGDNYITFSCDSLNSAVSKARLTICYANNSQKVFTQETDKMLLCAMC